MIIAANNAAERRARLRAVANHQNHHHHHNNRMQHNNVAETGTRVDPLKGLTPPGVEEELKPPQTRLSIDNSNSPLRQSDELDEEADWN